MKSAGRLRIIFFFLFVFVLVPIISRSDEMTGRGLFVWSLEDAPVLSSKEQIVQLIDFAHSHGIKTLFVQIYRANQAWFPSKVADSTPYQDCLKKTSIDPFAFLIKKAHEQNIQVHAWLNMLSLGSNQNAKILQKYGPGILTRNIQTKKSLNDYKIDNQFFLEPSDQRVQKELLDIVSEVLLTYPDLDGVQFDYIRYPDVHPFYGYTKSNMECFKKATGCKLIVESDPQWKQWKRDQVTELLEILVKQARLIRPHIHISTTGCLSYSRAYYEALQDWPSWINRHIIEFVTVMNYPLDAKTFEENIRGIKSHIKDLGKLNIAIGAYKQSQPVEEFRKQFDICQESKLGACVFFHYNALMQKIAFSRILDRK